MSYSTLYIWREDHCSAAGDGRGDFGPRTTYFYPQKYNFGRDRYDGAFQKYRSQHTAPPWVYLEVVII